MVWEATSDWSDSCVLWILCSIRASLGGTGTSAIKTFMKLDHLNSRLMVLLPSENHVPFICDCYCETRLIVVHHGCFVKWFVESGDQELREEENRKRSYS